MASAFSISGKDIVDWANNYTSRFTMPQLLRRLILASASNVKKLRLPSAEQVFRPGYDGVIEVEKGNVWIPDGISVWETGVDSSPGTKAQDDYSKRTRKSGLRRSTATFVFVTPRVWLRREAWCKKKQREKKWKAVRALDCSDLVEWLDSVPSVAFWAAGLLGKRPQGVSDITAHWQNICELSLPNLVPSVFLAGRDLEIKAVSEWLLQPPSILYFEAESISEVVDFFCAFSMSKLENERIEESRGVIVETKEAFRDLTMSTTPLILVINFELEPELTREAVRHGHHILMAVQRNIQLTQGTHRLRRMSSHEVERALVGASFDIQRAKRVGRECGGSSVVLKRLVVTGPPQLPKWALPTVAPKLAPFLLVGSWDDSNAEDREVVSEITGLTEAEVRALAQEWSHTTDQLFRRKDNTWRVLSRVDSWRWLAHYIDQRAANEYAKHFPDVVAVDDPRFELKAEQRFMASILGKKLKYSGALRKGLAEAYALLSVSSDAPNEIPATQISIKMWQLFDSVFPSDMTWRRWASVGDNLELFAEAEPDRFLDIVERELTRTPPSPAGMFGQEHFFGGSPATGLMWALEILGWESNYLLRVALCLASLSELDPGGNWNPRPFGVLTSLFHPLFPQTAALTKCRFEILDQIIKAEPKLGWRLLLQLLPKGQGIMLYNQHPRWRNWSEGWTGNARSKKEIAEERDFITDRIVSVADDNPLRLVELLNHISHFKAATRVRFLEMLHSMDVTRIDDPTREGLTTSVSEFINSNRRAPNAYWALPKSTIDNLETILKQIRPNDLCLRHRWVFQNWPQLPGLSFSASHEDHEIATTEARKTALTEIVQIGGIPLLRRMAQQSPVSWNVGKTAAAAKLVADSDILPAWLEDSDSKIIEAGQAFARTRFETEGMTWALSFKMANWSVQQIASFGLALPFEPAIWDFLKAQSQSVHDEYWSRSWGNTFTLSISGYERAIREWLSCKRPAPAVDLLARIVENQSPSVDLVLETLEMFLVHGNDRDVQRVLAWGGSRIGEIIKYLQTNPPIDDSRLLALEWGFLPFLLTASQSPVTLFTALATEPCFFVDLLANLYRPSDERDAPPKELTTEERNHVERARELLDEWRVLPGTQQDGSIAKAALRDWAEKVRQQAKTKNYADAAEYRVGKLLAHAPAELDGVWPCIPVRIIVEDWRSHELESGISCERFNEYQPNRVTKPIPEITWKDLVQKHRKDAKELAGQWPRTAALLRELADSYERTVRRHEQDNLNEP